jgi:hypothetical protein
MPADAGIPIVTVALAPIDELVEMVRVIWFRAGLEDTAEMLEVVTPVAVKVKPVVEMEDGTKVS